MNRTDRLVAIVMHLQGRRVVRAEELAAKFEVSLRTIYRDMAALGEAGVPLTGEAGVGYALVRGYHLPPVMLTGEEASALFLGGEMVKGLADASLHQPVESAMDKLRAVLPVERRDDLERLTRSTVVTGDWRPDRRNGDETNFLLTVRHAVIEQRLLRMAYRARGEDEDTEREVEPLGVIFSAGAWYLVAWCRLRDALRHFRLDRIQTLEIPGPRYAWREDFNLRRHLENETKTEQTHPARIWLHDSVIAWARQSSYATLSLELRRDGGAEYSLYTWCYEWLIRWLMTFGENAEVLEPVELRDKVRDLAMAAWAKYTPMAALVQEI